MAVWVELLEPRAVAAIEADGGVQGEAVDLHRPAGGAVAEEIRRALSTGHVDERELVGAGGVVPAERAGAFRGVKPIVTLHSSLDSSGTSMPSRNTSV
jgi:hypothetical protein